MLDHYSQPNPNCIPVLQDSGANVIPLGPGGDFGLSESSLFQDKLQQLPWVNLDLRQLNSLPTSMGNIDPLTPTQHSTLCATCSNHKAVYA